MYRNPNEASAEDNTKIDHRGLSTSLTQQFDWQFNELTYEYDDWWSLECFKADLVFKSYISV